MRLGGPQKWSEHIEEHTNLLSLSSIEPRFLGGPARGLVAMATDHQLAKGNSVQWIWLFG